MQKQAPKVLQLCRVKPCLMFSFCVSYWMAVRLRDYGMILSGRISIRLFKPRNGFTPYSMVSVAV